MRRFEIVLIHTTFNSDGVNWERHDAIFTCTKLAEGVQFGDGSTAVRWLSERSTSVWSSMGSLRAAYHVPEYADANGWSSMDALRAVNPDVGYVADERVLLWLDDGPHDPRSSDVNDYFMQRCSFCGADAPRTIGPLVSICDGCVAAAVTQLPQQK